MRNVGFNQLVRTFDFYYKRYAKNVHSNDFKAAIIDLGSCNIIINILMTIDAVYLEHLCNHFVEFRKKVETVRKSYRAVYYRLDF